MTANAASRLLRHYVDKSRTLPWRSAPGAGPPDPYYVWLSEVMLQQTTVATVVPRFARFIERWPTIEALAAARDEDVLSEWAGLGYYARARNLIACARAVTKRGGFPVTRSELRALPGVGDYTSAAIAAIAFGRDEAPVDTNVTRVIARLNGFDRPSKSAIERQFLDLAPPGRAGDVAQALMDIGATICRPRAPDCDACPLANACTALASGNPAAFPAPKARKVRPTRFGTAWWIERDDAVWLVRRPAKGLLGGMSALPGDDWTQASVRMEEDEPIGVVRHVFTHFALHLAIVARDEPQGEGWWHPLECLGEAGLPTLYLKAAALAGGANAPAA